MLCIAQAEIRVLFWQYYHNRVCLERDPWTVERKLENRHAKHKQSSPSPTGLHPSRSKTHPANRKWIDRSAFDPDQRENQTLSQD